MRGSTALGKGKSSVCKSWQMVLPPSVLPDSHQRPFCLHHKHTVTNKVQEPQTTALKMDMAPSLQARSNVKTRLHLSRCIPICFAGEKKKKSRKHWGKGEFFQITEALKKMPKPGHFQNSPNQNLAPSSRRPPPTPPCSASAFPSLAFLLLLSPKNHLPIPTHHHSDSGTQVSPLKVRGP